MCDTPIRCGFSTNLDCYYINITIGSRRVHPDTNFVSLLKSQPINCFRFLMAALIRHSHLLLAIGYSTAVTNDWDVTIILTHGITDRLLFVPTS